MTLFSHPKIADDISPEERRMIDDAVAAGRVTLCPPCTFSPSRDRPPNQKAVDRKLARWKRVRALAHLPAAEIAETLGLSIRMVWEDLRKMGISEPKYDVAKFWR